MACVASDFTPLQSSAAAEVARQINAAEPSAEKLVEQGFSWGIAYAIARQVSDGGNAGVLYKSGLSSSLAKAIAAACSDAFQRREAARKAAAEAKPVVRRGPQPSYVVPDPSWFW